jgi:hypothetical protein
MAEEVKINPPIFVCKRSGVSFELSTVGQVIDFVRRNEPGETWRELLAAAFIAAAVPSEENIDTLRALAAEAFESLK